MITYLKAWRIIINNKKKRYIPATDTVPKIANEALQKLVEEPADEDIEKRKRHGGNKQKHIQILD